MSTSRGRWTDLPADDRQRRQAQSDAARTRAAAGSADLTPAERHRRAVQSRTDQAAAGVGELSAEEQRRRQAQSDAAKARPKTGSDTTTAERRRRTAQSRTDQQRAGRV